MTHKSPPPPPPHSSRPPFYFYNGGTPGSRPSYRASPPPHQQDLRLAKHRKCLVQTLLLYISETGQKTHSKKFLINNSTSSFNDSWLGDVCEGYERFKGVYKKDGISPYDCLCDQTCATYDLHQGIEDEDYGQIGERERADSISN